MQTIYETQSYTIKRSILGVAIYHLPTGRKTGLTGESAQLFLSVFKDNLEITPPSAVDAAMDDLCGHYFKTIQINTGSLQPA